MGTSSSILFHSRSTNPNRITTVNAVPGNPNEQSAYRSKLAGISGSLAITAAVCCIHDINEGSITLGLDGRQALLAAAGDWPLNPARPNFDLITDIRAKVKSLPVSVKWKWVEGHQDDDQSSHLDEWAKANILVDNIAKAFWNHLNITLNSCRPRTDLAMRHGRYTLGARNSTKWTSPLSIRLLLSPR
jgi:hypothetical protein